MSTHNRAEIPADHEGVLRLVAILEARRDWISAAELVYLFPAWNDRDLRDYARASAGVVGSGQRGYKLTKHMTREEANHSAARLRSQARDMNARAAQIEDAWQQSHQDGGASVPASH